MLTIHGVPFSAHTRKVIVAAIEKGIEYEIVPVVPLTPPPNWRELSPPGTFRQSSTTVSGSPIRP